MSNTTRKVLGFLAGAVLASALGGCATGNLRIWTYDEKAEAEKGAKAHQGIVARSGTAQKPDLSQYVAEVGGKIAAVSDRPALKWEFTILDTAEPRAFSTRGGHVYMTRGMIALMRSEDDLAAVLAHEIAHICNLDATRTETTTDLIMWSNLAAVIAVQPWGLLLPQIAFAPGGASLAALSRHNEFNADRDGAEYLRRAGYPTESMSAALELLASLEAYQRDHEKLRKHSWWDHRVFASHPATGKRQKALGGSGTSSDASPDPLFLARLDGLEFGSTSRQGIPAGSKRYFTRLNVLIEVPENWTADMTRDKLWLFAKGRRVHMSLERVGRGTADDLCDALMSFTNGSALTEIQKASDNGVQSCTGRSGEPRRGAARRMGIVARDEDASVRYVFRVFSAAGSENDPVFLAIARSIESPGEEGPKPPTVRIRKAQEGDTFATLAKTARGIPDAEAALRLLNHRYPSGELEPGQLVKLIE